MDELLRTWASRTGITAASVPGLVVAGVGAVVAVVVAVRAPLLPLPSVVAPPAAGATAPTVTPAPATPSATVVVHVAGAVAEPGVVELSAGARVADALAAAGGSTPDAALAAVNLARALVDGEQLVVPTHDEVAAGVVPTPADGGGPDRALDGRLPDGRLDLNAATAAQLEELPGIGPVLAGRIVAHRVREGRFDEAVALREVPGIGEATWAGLRDLVGVVAAP